MGSSIFAAPTNSSALGRNCFPFVNVCFERRGECLERILLSAVAMENMEVLVRGLVMQNAGAAASMGLESFVSFQGVQLQVLWVVAVATIVLALVSVTRQVSYVSIGWSWGSKPGQVRVRVQSFSSLVLEDGIEMFSAEILSNCHSADSCSEDAEPAMFIFENQDQNCSALCLPKQSSAPPPGKIVRKRSKSLDFQKAELLPRSKSFDLQKVETRLLLESRPAIATSRPIVLSEGIVWEAAPAACGVVDGENSRARSRIDSPVCADPRKSACCEEFDPLLKLRIRDAVVSDCMRSFSAVRDVSFPLAPVAVRDGGIAALGDGIVRVWDSETRRLRKNVLLPKGGDDSAVTAFDVHWGLEAVVMARKGGLVSLVDLESAAYRSVFESQQSVVQAVRLGSSPFSKTMLIGGPSPADPGCFAALWDSRSSRRELTVDLASASAIHGILSRGVELHIGDEAGSLAVHDMRMLGGPTLARVPCEGKVSGAPEDRWWEIDATLEEADDIDDDDFMDCRVAEETKRGATTSMSTLVTVMSRSFSSKAT